MTAVRLAGSEPPSGNTTDPKFVECLPKTVAGMVPLANQGDDFEAFMSSCMEDLPENFQTSWDPSNPDTAGDVTALLPDAADSPRGTLFEEDQESPSGDAAGTPRGAPLQEGVPLNGSQTGSGTLQVLAPPAMSDSGDDEGLGRTVILLVIGAVGAHRSCGLFYRVVLSPV